VGKTNILLRFIDKNYSMSHTPTIGVDFRSKVIEVPLANRSDKRRIKLQLWDTAGQERFRTLTDTYFKGASGIVIVYAVDDRRSFEDVGNWMVQL
jgi:small GTP-binding protein